MERITRLIAATVLTLTCMLITSRIACAGSGALTDSSVGDVFLVKAVGPGKLFLGGNLIEGPWTLAYDHGRLTVNGFALRPPPPPAPPSPARRAENEFLNGAGKLADSLSRSGLSLADRGTRFAQYVEGNDLGYRVRVESTDVELQSPRGVRFSFGLVPLVLHDIGSMPNVSADRPISERENRIGRLELLMRPLENGDVVFVVDRVTMVVWPRARKGEVMAAIDRLRRGAELDSLDRHLLSRAVRGPLVRPTALDSIW
jgi:hypothetical protein